MREGRPIEDCWNKIGVWGNAECPELTKHVHCRNCPVYSSAAAEMLNGMPPSGYIPEWTALIAREREGREVALQSVMIFGIGTEWLALSTQVFKEVAQSKAIHSIPHRNNGLVLGIVNIRGELLICVSLAHALGLEKTAAPGHEKKQGIQQRMLVIDDGGQRLVFPVDQVGGIHQFGPKELKEIPSTLTGAAANHTTGLLSWRNKSVGRLDEQLLFYTLNKGMS